MIPDIKKVVTAEVDMLAGLFNDYRVFYSQSPDIPAAAAYLQERISKNESTVFMAIVAGETVGFVQLYPIYSSLGMQRAWLLNDLFVAEKCRRQGIAKSLLAAAKDFALETNARYLLLQTAYNNFNAQALYEGTGWIKQTDFFYELPLSI